MQSLQSIIYNKLLLLIAIFIGLSGSPCNQSSTVNLFFMKSFLASYSTSSHSVSAIIYLQLTGLLFEKRIANVSKLFACVDNIG